MANDVTPQALRRPAYGMRGALQGQYLVTFLDGVSVGVRIYSLSRSELKRELFQPSNDRTHLASISAGVRDTDGKVGRMTSAVMAAGSSTARTLPEPRARSEA